jgi:hypothetical protein
MAHFFAKITEHFFEISREDEITIFSQKYLDIIYQLLHTYWGELCTNVFE